MKSLHFDTAWTVLGHARDGACERVRCVHIHREVWLLSIQWIPARIYHHVNPYIKSQHKSQITHKVDDLVRRVYDGVVLLVVQGDPIHEIYFAPCEVYFAICVRYSIKSVKYGHKNRSHMDTWRFPYIWILVVCYENTGAVYGIGSLDSTSLYK